MKLDVNVLRYLSKDEFRTLTAVEMGQKNHEIVPSQLVDSIAGLKHGGTFKCLRTLLRHKLVHHDASKYEGYRLTTLGYDFLAIRALVARGAIAGVGRQIGVGKESDVFEVNDDEGNVYALKLHRLGRTSFRAVKSKRDYLKRGSHFSWLYLSRLAALKEYAFMKALGDAGLPVPRAIECNRHAVLMTLVEAHPLVQVCEMRHPQRVYTDCMNLLVRLARLGLVHCDFNEFNLLISDDEKLTLIDFPQMISTSHPNAKELFDRDVEGVVRFFERKLGYLPEDDETLNVLKLVRPRFEDAIANDKEDSDRIDSQLRASGFKREHEAALEKFAGESTTKEGSSESGEEESSEEESSEEGSGDCSEPSAETSSIVIRCDSPGAPDRTQDSSLAKTFETLTLPPNDESEDQIADDEQIQGKTKAQLMPSAPSPSVVASRVAQQRRRDIQRKTLTNASRNAMKNKNKGKKKGDGGKGFGGDW